MQNNFNPQISDFEDAVAFVQAQADCSYLQAEDSLVSGISVEDQGMSCDEYYEAFDVAWETN